MLHINITINTLKRHRITNKILRGGWGGIEGSRLKIAKSLEREYDVSVQYHKPMTPLQCDFFIL